MAKYRNVFKEASRRLKDFKSRGFIPDNSPLAFQDFVQEVKAENRGQSYSGAYTAGAYEAAYGVEVDYFQNTTFQDVDNMRKIAIFKRYKEELGKIFGINDFLELAPTYGISLESTKNLSEVLNLARQAQSSQPYFFRNARGRNRQTESDLMGSYHNQFVEEINALLQDATMEQMRFM